MKVNFRKNKFVIPQQFVKINIMYIPRDYWYMMAVTDNAKHKARP